MKSLEIKTVNVLDITYIRNEILKRFCISEDEEDGQKFFSILYVTNIDEAKHEHIDLSLDHVKVLRDFLIKYFEDNK